MPVVQFGTLNPALHAAAPQPVNPQQLQAQHAVMHQHAAVQQVHQEPTLFEYRPAVEPAPPPPPPIQVQPPPVNAAPVNPPPAQANVQFGMHQHVIATVPGQPGQQQAQFQVVQSVHPQVVNQAQPQPQPQPQVLNQAQQAQILNQMLPAASPAPAAPAQQPAPHCPGAVIWRGLTRAEVNAQNIAIAQRIGANRPHALVPQNPANGQQWWCREVDGTYTLRSTYDIMESCQPGRWVYGSTGYVYFIRFAPS